MFINKKNYPFKNAIAIVTLIAMLVSLGGPITSKAEEDNFPLPETFVDPLPEDQDGTDGDDGEEGDTGDDGEEGEPKEFNGEDGENGDDGDGSDSGDLPEDGDDGDDGDSTESGEPGGVGTGRGDSRLGRAANVYINTGDASAYGSIVNFINSTVIGSPDIDVINIYGPSVGTLDFSNFISNSSSGDSSFGSDSVSVDVNNEDTDVINDLKLNASSGVNRVEGAGGNVVIETGDVYVDASIMNMVNTSLIGRDWNFKVINIFSDLAGDLILPSLYSEKASAGCSGCLSSINVDVNNSDTVINNTLDVNSDTGNNSAAGAGDQAYINTGDASADSSVFNLVNTTVVGDDWYYARFHVGGEWEGSVYNTNSTAEFTQSGNDYTVRGDNHTDDSSQDHAEYESFYGHLFDARVENTDVNIQNNITIDASSGDNTATDAYGNAIIQTGDATARSSITNVVNTTVIGDGWQFFLVNIFGDWSGSVHYGMPDLAVSEVAIPSRTPVSRGDTISYVYSYTNGGDTPAHDVVLRDRFDADKVHVTDTNGGIVRGNTITWKVGTLNPRETRVIRYNTRVNSRDGALPVQNEVTISSSNGDRDSSNNGTGGQVEIAAIPSSGSSGSGGSGYSGGYSLRSGFIPEFHVVKATDRDTYNAGETIPFIIIIDNFKPHSGYSVEVVDQFVSPSDDPILTGKWDLGEVVGFEHIEITYDIPIPKQVVPGPYSNNVIIYSKNANGNSLPPITTSLPISITNTKVDGAETESYNAETVWLDLLLQDDTSSTATSTATSTTSSTSTATSTEVFTETASSDFEITQAVVTRQEEAPEVPIVFGHSSDRPSGGIGIAGNTSEGGSAFSVVGDFMFNLVIAFFMTLFGILGLLAYRYKREWLKMFSIFKQNIISISHTLLNRVEVMSHGYISIDKLAPVIKRFKMLSRNMFALLPFNINNSKKVSRVKSAKHNHGFRTRKISGISSGLAVVALIFTVLWDYIRRYL